MNVGHCQSCGLQGKITFLGLGISMQMDHQCMVEVAERILHLPMPAPPESPKEAWEEALDRLRTDVREVEGRPSPPPRTFHVVMSDIHIASWTQVRLRLQELGASVPAAPSVPDRPVESPTSHVGEEPA